MKKILIVIIFISLSILALIVILFMLMGQNAVCCQANSKNGINNILIYIRDHKYENSIYKNNISEETYDKIQIDTQNQNYEFIDIGSSSGAFEYLIFTKIKFNDGSKFNILLKCNSKIIIKCSQIDNKDYSLEKISEVK